MSAFHIWREDAPPKDTWVWAKYCLVGDKWQLVKTCKRGCCVYSFGTTLVLPAYWKEASAAEAAAEQAACNRIKPIDLWALFNSANP